MREDMFKVIVERPRRRKSRGGPAARLGNDLEGPMRLYGSDDVYAVAKRQISTREIRRHGLRT